MTPFTGAPTLGESLLNPTLGISHASNDSDPASVACTPAAMEGPTHLPLHAAAVVQGTVFITGCAVASKPGFGVGGTFARRLGLEPGATEDVGTTGRKPDGDEVAGSAKCKFDMTEVTRGA
jgi:hypothetical protein